MSEDKLKQLDETEIDYSDIPELDLTKEPISFPRLQAPRFKLRAWYKPYNEMIYFDSIEMVNSGNYFKDKSYCLAVHSITDGESYVHDDWAEPVDDCDYTLMHCIGLLDKNNKFIYESDIIRYKWTDYLESKNEIILFVTYYKYRFCVFSINNELYEGEIYNIIDGEVEIIGNIYENGDLLDAR